MQDCILSVNILIQMLKISMETHRNAWFIKTKKNIYVSYIHICGYKNNTHIAHNNT